MNLRLFIETLPSFPSWNLTEGVSSRTLYMIFYAQVNVHRDKSLQENQPDALISQIYFWNKTLHVSDSSSVHHQEFFTVHATMVYVIQVFLTTMLYVNKPV